ncbi:MAG: hypothetical protein US76_00220 [Parcubacteria group bacterium GW2011_GWA2_38_13b]|nr:MAG: hypothetical protein US76_00220 [Parcubacteria group bacterium GW2011_GWA2_38_13b]
MKKKTVKKVGEFTIVKVNKKIGKDIIISKIVYCKNSFIILLYGAVSGKKFISRFDIVKAMFIDNGNELNSISNLKIAYFILRVCGNR